MNIEKAKEVLQAMAIERKRELKNVDKEYCLYNILENEKQAIEVVLNELEKKDKIIDKILDYAVGVSSEVDLDNIYAELNNCRGIERDWCRGDKKEKEMLKQYFEKETEKKK